MPNIWDKIRTRKVIRGAPTQRSGKHSKSTDQQNKIYCCTQLIVRERLRCKHGKCKTPTVIDTGSQGIQVIDDNGEDTHKESQVLGEPSRNEEAEKTTKK